jgi:hypothetical protein
MKNYQKILLILALGLVFILVYSPHFDYRFPFHIDEWHHIRQVRKLASGQYEFGISGTELGFHLFLLPLYKISNLILIYRFLPALWAVISAAALFYVVYKKTSQGFWSAILAVVFFASIKSNVNITGLWFFTPLTFSIPFIFLYVYFFTEGITEQNKKYILVSLGIMAFLIPIHAVSVLFALPILLIYALIHYRYLLKEYKFFSIFLIIPLIGVLFYKYSFGVSGGELIGNLFDQLQFKRGWGVLELKNPLTSFYSWLGYVLALVGILFIFINKKAKKYMAYLIWPSFTLILIIIYRLFGISYLSPYQRNLYYFAISLPLLSGIGLYSIIETTQNYFTKSQIKILVGGLIFVITGLLVFRNYHFIDYQVDLYRVIDENDYQALSFLADLPEGTTLATPFISTALYPISGRYPLSTLFFELQERASLEKFFTSPGCEYKNELIGKYEDIKYVISKRPIACDWDLIYQDNNYIYRVND